MIQGFQLKRAMVRAHLGTCPKAHSGGIDGVVGDKIFPLERVMSYSEFTLENFVGQLILTVKHTLQLHGADFIGWMQLSYFNCSFHRC